MSSTPYKVKINGKTKGFRATKEGAANLGLKYQKQSPSSSIQISRVREHQPAKKRKQPAPSIPVYVVCQGRVIKVRSV